jgi:hypothetical protein
VGGGRRDIISLTVAAYPASSRRERRRTCSHQNGRKNWRYAVLTVREAPSGGSTVADLEMAPEDAMAAR